MVRGLFSMVKEKLHMKDNGLMINLMGLASCTMKTLFP